MSPRQRQYAYIGAGVLVLLVLYRWYANRSAGSSTAAGPVNQQDGTAGADYAQLAGQQQSDSAALSNQEQGDVQALQSNEQSDFADLSAAIGGVGADVSGLTSAYSGVAGQLDSLTGHVADLDPTGNAITNLTQRVNHLASGQRKASRQLTRTQSRLKAAQDALKATRTAAANRRHAAAGHTAHHGHQSMHKQGGSGAVAPSTHETKPRVTAAKPQAVHAPTVKNPPRSGPANRVTAKPAPAKARPKPPAPKSKAKASKR